jgi:hypothetical protein
MDNGIQITFIFQRNLHTNLNTCPTVSQVPGNISLWISFAAIFFCPQKPHNDTLFYRGTRIQGRRHLVTAATSVQSCAY